MTEEQTVNNRNKLLQFTKEVLMPDKTEEEIFDLLQEYAEEIERVREDYRNPSAHTNELTQIEAKECFDLVIDVEKLLKRMLDSFAN